MQLELPQDFFVATPWADPLEPMATYFLRKPGFHGVLYGDGGHQF